MRKKNNIIIIILTLLFCAMFALAFESIDLFIALLIISLILFGTVDKVLNQGEEYFGVVAWSWTVGLVFTAIVYLIYQFQYGQPYWVPGKDDVNFDINWSDYVLQQGYYSISEMMKDREFILWNCNGYTLFIAFLKRIAIFEYHTMIPRVINIGTLVFDNILLASYIEKHIVLDKRHLKKMIFIMSVFPNVLFISSHVYRDQICAFMFVTCFYLWSDFSNKSILKKAGIIVATIFLLYWGYWFRATNIVILLGIIAISIYNKSSWEPVFKRKVSIKTVFLALLFVVGFGYATRNYWEVLSRWITRYNYVERDMINLGRLQKFVYGVGMLPFGWALRLIYYLTNPFDSHALNFFANLEGRDYLIALVSVGTLCLMYLYPYVFSSLKRKNNLVFVFIGILLSCGLTTSGFRHMITFYPFMFTLGFSELAVERNKNNKSLFLIISSCVCFALIGMAVMLEI